MKIEWVVLGVVLIVFGSVFSYSVTTIDTVEPTTGEDTTWFIIILIVVGMSIIIAGVLCLLVAREEKK